jgi:hypothetical protein
MSFFGRSERGIGRGEVAEGRLEAPFFFIFLVLCCLVLVAVQLSLGQQSITVALAVCMISFGFTVMRVEIGVFILVVAMLLSPEIEAGSSMSGDRSLNIRYDDVLIIVIFLGVMVKLAFEGHLSLWIPSPINRGIAIYYILCLFSTLLAIKHDLPAWDRRTAFFVLLKMLEFYMIFFLVGHAVRTYAQVRRLLGAFFVVALIVSAYGIYSIETTPRVSAPFEKGGTEPNTLGGYLMVVLLVATGLVTQAKQWRHRYIMLGIGGVAFWPFLFTLSRASYLGLLVGLSTMALATRRYTLMVCLAVVLFLSPHIMPDKVQERVAYTFQAESGQEVVMGGREMGLKVDKSTQERFLVWRKVRFMLGIGAVFTLFGGGVSWETVLDSQYARVILETGLVGLAAFLFLQFSLLRATHQAFRWSRDWVGKGVALGLFSTTLALNAHSAGTISFLIVRIMEPYWFLMAMTAVIRNKAIAEHWHYYRLKQTEEDDTETKEKSSKSVAA